ncbi:MAG: hypothetical protein WCI02_09830 [Planctomycetota bacterium]
MRSFSRQMLFRTALKTVVRRVSLFRITLWLFLLPSITFGQSPKGNVERALVLPESPKPVSVLASFHLSGINEIDSQKESFQASGTLTLTWNDPRQAFDPTVSGMAVKVYQGGYQFNEIAPAWYPQVILANEFGGYEKRGTILRIYPDGTNTLTESVSATARADFNLRHLPFDKQTLELEFQLFGFSGTEISFGTTEPAVTADRDRIRVPQWEFLDVQSQIGVAPSDRNGAPSFVVHISVARQPLFMLRTIILPLIFCVFLCMSVFWMEPTHLGDRMNVSCFGILTSIAYLIVISDLLPQVSEVTLTHAFLNGSLLMMLGTAIVNLVVSTWEKQQRPGRWLDVTCRWLFPSIYLGLIGAAILYFGILT